MELFCSKKFFIPVGIFWQSNLKNYLSCIFSGGKPMNIPGNIREDNGEGH
jgi:hypothetical protein